jgi:NAD(P)H dehydrogenase (quinone)
MDSPPLYYRWVKGDPGHLMMKDILTFCGVTPVARTYFGSVKTSTEAKRRDWLERSYRLGRED